MNQKTMQCAQGADDSAEREAIATSAATEIEQLMQLQRSLSAGQGENGAHLGHILVMRCIALRTLALLYVTSAWRDATGPTTEDMRQTVYGSDEVAA